MVKRHDPGDHRYPQEPIPGSGSSKIIAYAKEKDGGREERPDFVPRMEQEEPEVRTLYISKKDIDTYGPTKGVRGVEPS